MIDKELDCGVVASGESFWFACEDRPCVKCSYFVNDLGGQCLAIDLWEAVLEEIVELL